MRWGLFAGTMFAGALLLLAAKRPITVKDMLSYDSPPEPHVTWAPDGSAFVYEQNGSVYLQKATDSKPEVWFETGKLESSAKAPAATGKFEWQNRRVAEHEFQWFPNAKDLLIALKGDLFVVHPDGKYSQITATEVPEEDPKLSPDGKEVLYRSNANLYVLNLESRQIRQLTTDGTRMLLDGQLDWVYPEELELHTASWWSPDSKQIAYLQFDVSHEFVYPQADLLARRAVSEPERYPQAGTPNASVRLGVVSAQGGPTKWMLAGNSPDKLLARVAWLPDSSSVALEVFPREQNALDMLFCNPADGTVKTVIHEQSKTWINVADNLFFLKSRPEFLWTSERSGFRHIYRYSNKGELLGQLTNGDWQVSGISAVDEPNRRIYYTSSETNPLEAQLYTVNFDGGERTRLTSPGSDHGIQASPNGSYYVDTFSSLSRPSESVLSNAHGKQIALLRKADTRALEEYDFRSPEIVPVQSPGGVTLYAKMIKPAGFEHGKKYPAIVHVYGGPGVQEVRNTWSGIDWDQALAAHGYVVWQLDNRGSSGRGHAFEEPIYHELGKQEVTDQRLGVEYLVNLGFVDPARIGITGWSYGGYMTIHSLLLAPDLFKVGVAGAPVTDWHNYDTIYTERYMGLPDENPQGYDRSSNVENAAKLQGRLLILHNFEDDNVLFQNTLQMTNALETDNKPYFLQLYPQKAHGVSGTFRKPLYEAMTGFFDRNLK
jgi:dipeptidyl-peptidase 4